MQDRHFFTDTATATLEYVGDSDLSTDDFDPSQADTVTLDTPWEEFFGTDEYVRFDATVAQPIVQPYLHRGELKKFKKDEQELKRAQAQLGNLPWTVGHPENDRVTSADDIRGFWENPRWNDGQDATLHVPSDDHEAVRFAVTHDEVSVGFSGDLDWVDEEGVDAIQRNMAYDHVASVENGRCPPEKGCGLHTDDADSDLVHGHVTDAVRSISTEEDDTEIPDVPDSEEWDEGDWVSFTTPDGDRRHGKLAYVDVERALVKVYDTETEQFATNPTTVATASLNDWVGPHTDSCPGNTCSCGCHLHTDSPDGIHVEDGNWYGIAPSETAEDESKYELDNCNDVKDAYNLRNNGDYDVDTSTLVSRIKRAANSHDCPTEQKPWVDDTTTDTDMTNLAELLNDNDITAEQVLDHFEIERNEHPTEFYDGDPDVDTLADDFDAIEDLVDERDLLEEKQDDLEGEVDSLREEVREANRPVYADKAEDLAEMSEKWGDKDALMDKFDADDEDERWTTDDLDEKIDLVTDIKGEDTTTVADSGDDPPEDDDAGADNGRFDLRQRTKVE